MELLAANDCLYRSMYHFDSVTILGMREMIVPRKAGLPDWSTMLDRAKREAEPKNLGEHVMIKHMIKYNIKKVPTRKSTYKKI